MGLPVTYYDMVVREHSGLAQMVTEHASELALEAPLGTIDDHPAHAQRFVDYLRDNVVPANLADELDMMPPEIADAVRRQVLEASKLINIQYHVLLNFEMFGRKTFHFGHNLTDHLVSTELNLESNALRLPFPSCMFVFSARSAINAIAGIDGKEDSWFRSYPYIDYNATISVFLYERPAPAGYAGRKIVMAAFYAKSLQQCHVAQKRELFLGEDWNLEQSLRTNWRGEEPTLDYDKDDPVFSRYGNDEFFYTNGLGFIRLVMNAALYLSSSDPEVISHLSDRTLIEAQAEKLPRGNKRRRMFQSASAFSALDYADVGPSTEPIRVTRTETEKPDGPYERQTGSRTSNVRFMVRGHWRQQAHGPGSRQRKLIWIRPFYKGPDMADLISKPYIVT